MVRSRIRIDTVGFELNTRTAYGPLIVTFCLAGSTDATCHRSTLSRIVVTPERRARDGQLAFETSILGGLLAVSHHKSKHAYWAHPC
jgi:hypothetical protein